MKRRIKFVTTALAMMLTLSLLVFSVFAAVSSLEPAGDFTFTVDYDGMYLLGTFTATLTETSATGQFDRDGGEGSATFELEKDGSSTIVFTLACVDENGSFEYGDTIAVKVAFEGTLKGDMDGRTFTLVMTHTGDSESYIIQGASEVASEPLSASDNALEGFVELTIEFVGVAAETGIEISFTIEIVMEETAG